MSCHAAPVEKLAKKEMEPEGSINWKKSWKNLWFIFSYLPGRIPVSIFGRTLRKSNLGKSQD